MVRNQKQPPPQDSQEKDEKIKFSQGCFLDSRARSVGTRKLRFWVLQAEVCTWESRSSRQVCGVSWQQRSSTYAFDPILKRGMCVRDQGVIIFLGNDS